MIHHNLDFRFVKHPLISLIIILVVFQSKAQQFEPGYVITLEKDTIKGVVLVGDHVVNVQRCVFKETSSSAETTYAPSDIFAYGTRAGRFYRSFSRPTEGVEHRIFVERLYSGKVSLFFNTDDFFIEHDNQLEQLTELEKEVKQGDRKFVVKQALYRATLQNAMRDCPNSFNTVSKTKLNRKDLLNLMLQYHECIGMKGSDVSVNRELAIRLGVGVGAMWSGWNWSSNSSPDYSFMDLDTDQPTLSLTPSIWIELWRPNVNSRLRLRTGLNFYSTTYHHTRQSAITGLKHDMNLAMSRIEIPLQLKYFLSQKGPYIFGGLAVGKILTFDDKLTITSYPGDFVIKESSALSPADILLNFFGGFGYELPMGSRAVLFEADFRLTGSITKSLSSSPSGGIRAVTLTVGFPLSKNR
jgi:hypothetical protein